MSKRDEFVALLNALKAASPTITDQQRKGLLRQATQDYSLSIDEAAQILKDSGLVVGELVNYFEVLGFSIDEFDGLSEGAIASKVDDVHQKLFQASLSAGARRRPDGSTEDQWRAILDQARDTLKDASKRKEHLAALRHEEELTETPVGGASRPIFKFPNGDEATSIPQLATLMEKNTRDATEALYRGYIEQSLGGAGEMHFADAAHTVISQYSDDREMGLRVIVQILRGKMRFDKGGEASTSEQIAQLIDRNWEQGKNYLYNGFMALWLKYARQERLADTANNIASRYRDDRDIGLEMFVQKLHPQIGQPKLETSHAEIDFGEVDAEKIAQGSYTSQFTLTNSGRGHLYGTVQSSQPWLEVDVEDFSGNQVSVKVTLVGLGLPAYLEIQSNGGALRIPVHIAPTLSLGEVGERGYLMPKAFEIMSAGDWEARTSTSWLQLESSDNSISVSAKPNKAGVGSNQGNIVISGGTDTMRLSVGLVIRPAPFYIKHRLAIGAGVVSVVLIALLGYYLWVNVIQFNRLDTTNNPYLAMQYLGSRNELHASRASQALVRIGEPAVAPLIDALASDSRRKRAKAGTTLEQLGEVAVQPLIKSLEHRDYRVRTSAVEILGRIGEPAVTSLIDTLTSDNMQKRTKATATLEQLGEVAVLPLIKAFEHQDAGVRTSAGDILARIGEPAAAPLMEALTSDNKQKRAKAAATLEQLGEAAVQPLIKALEHRDDGVRKVAAATLEQLGEVAIQPLIKSLEHQDDGVRKVALEILVRIRYRHKDGMKMVYIPAGEFQMGTSDAQIKEMLRENPDWKENWFDDEKPVHTVYLNAYYIDAHEVTNAQYRKFVEATGHHEPEGEVFVNGKWQEDFKPWKDPNFNKPNQPVVCVSWEDARAYAEWAGARLPTEAQWEKAARGGLVGKKYPWGNKLSHDYANYEGTGGRDRWKYTAPVGSFPTNGYGLYDMAGNVREWCLDAYEEEYYSRSPNRNPVNRYFTKDKDKWRVVRGGSWYFSIRYVRCANRSRNVLAGRNSIVGFRCVVAED